MIIILDSILQLLEYYSSCSIRMICVQLSKTSNLIELLHYYDMHGPINFQYHCKSQLDNLLQ